MHLQPYLLSSMTTYVFLTRHILFSVFMSKTLETKHMHIMPMKHYVDSLKYFVSHICSCISMLPFVFLVWQSYLVLAKAYEVFSTIHKHLIFGSQSCSFISMNT